MPIAQVSRIKAMIQQQNKCEKKLTFYKFKFNIQFRLFLSLKRFVIVFIGFGFYFLMFFLGVYNRICEGLRYSKKSKSNLN